MYKKSEKLRLLREAMETGKQEYMACKDAGVTQKQLGVWSKLDPRIERYRVALEKKVDHKRNNMVVDSLFKSAVNGNVGALAIWLKFKMGWKDNALIDQSTHHYKTFVYLDPKAKEEDARSNRTASQLPPE